jgi:hypothetical protein
MLDNAARKSASSSDLSVCHVEQLYTDAQRSTARARLVLDVLQARSQLRRPRELEGWILSVEVRESASILYTG